MVVAAIEKKIKRISCPPQRSTWRYSFNSVGGRTWTRYTYRKKESCIGGTGVMRIVRGKQTVERNVGGSRSVKETAPGIRMSDRLHAQLNNG